MSARAALLGAGLVVSLGSVVPFASAQESLLDGAKASARTGAPSALVAYGRALRRAGHTSEAKEPLKRAVAQVANGALAIEARWELARVAIAERSFQSALGICRGIAEIEATSGVEVASHACIAEAQLLWKRGSEALDETALALAKGSRSYDAKVAEGEAHELQAEDEAAERSFREAIAWEPGAWQAHLALGRLLVRRAAANGAVVRTQPAYVEGERALRRAIELDPSGPEEAYALALALPPGEEAASLLERATRERPVYPEALRALSTLDLALGKLAGARAAAERALSAEPKNAASHVVLGTVALAENRPDDAIREGEAALAVTPNSAPGKLLVADGHARKGEVDLALEAYQAAYGLDRANPAPLLRALAACLAASRGTSAKAFGERLTKEFPSYGPGWVGLGDALVAYGDSKGARAAYETALAKGGVDEPDVRRKLAALH